MFERRSLSPRVAAGVIPEQIHDITYSHILLPTNLDEREASTLLMAVRLAAAYGAELTVLHVLRPEESPNAMHWLDALDGLHRKRASVALVDAVERGRKAILSFVQRIPAELCDRVTIHLECRIGDPATEVARFADSQDIDLVMFSSPRSRWQLRLRIDLARRVMRLTTKPVLIVHSHAMPAAKQIPFEQKQTPIHRPSGNGRGTLNHSTECPISQPFNTLDGGH